MAQTDRHYDVFVNFRGADTRQGLVSVLREKLKAARIRYFYDDESMYIGNEIAEELKRGIKNSQIYVVILSPNYASSKWCLRELSLMVECKEICNSKEIFPIFYGVSVNDVKLRTEMFKNDLEKHDVGPEVLTQWKKALNRVARIKGRHVGRDTEIADFSNSIAEAIHLRLETRRLSCDLAGMDEKAESVKKLLDIESLDIRFLVIHGNSGAGKTSLARVIFDQICARFDGCSFIADVKECSRGWIGESSCCDGYEYMEKRLLKDIPGDADELNNRLGSKRVLVVLDDVDKDDSMKLKSIRFGAGSRIIITTKKGPIGLGTEPEGEDEHPQQPKDVLYYELKTMSFDDALKLLKRRAFGNVEEVTYEQDTLARSALNSLGLRVPLTIEIVGSFLYRRSKQEWQDTIERLDNVSNYEVRLKLRIIYNALKEDERKVFLDIACFFVNAETTYVEHMWNSCLLDSGIKLLTSMSLVKVIDNKVWMHEELRTLGREIVSQNSEFGKRLWKHDDAWEVLQRDKDKEGVVGLRLSYDAALKKATLAVEKFRGLEKLRFLRLYYTKFCKKLEDVLPELRWLSWHHCPDDLNTLQLSLRSLAVLVLSESSTTDGWLGCNQLQEKAARLKVLDLRNCHELTGTPELSNCKKLEMLVLQECGKLTRIDGSIGALTLLKHLIIKGCGSIEELPEALGSLEKLEVIIIEGNSQSLKLPESIGKLKSLSTLVVANVAISEFPDVGGLQKLVRLSLSRCSGIKRLPDSLGKLNSLEELDISGSTVLHLPRSMGKLKELKVIKMERSSIRKLPSSINLLKKLEELHAKECGQLEGEISGVDELLRLRILDLSYTCVTGLSQTMSRLSLLQTLHLDGCRSLHGLTELPENLTSLHISFQLLHKMLQARLPELKNVNDLVIFNTGDDEQTELQQSMVFQWIGGLPKLEHLEMDIPSISGSWPGNLCASSQLKFIKLSSCAEMLPQHQLHLPLTLSSISLSNFEVNLSHFNELQELRYLKLDKCRISGDKRVEVGSMSLVHFYARRCSFDNNVKQIHPSKSLRFLHLKRCRFHQTQLKLSGLDKLKHLELLGCRGLISVQGIDEVEQLGELVIKRCDSLECLEGDISQLKKLVFLEIIDCEDLKRIEGWSFMKKEKTGHRCIYDCPNFRVKSRKRKRSRISPNLRI